MVINYSQEYATKKLYVLFNEHKKEQEMTKTRIWIYGVHLISSGATTLYKIYSYRIIY